MSGKPGSSEKLKGNKIFLNYVMLKKFFIMPWPERRTNQLVLDEVKLEALTVRL